MIDISKWQVKRHYKINGYYGRILASWNNHMSCSPAFENAGSHISKCIRKLNTKIMIYKVYTHNKVGEIWWSLLGRTGGWLDIGSTGADVHDDSSDDSNVSRFSN